MEFIGGVQMAEVEFKAEETLRLEVLLDLEDALLSWAFLRVDRKDQGLRLKICLQLLLRIAKLIDSQSIIVFASLLVQPFHLHVVFLH